MTDATKVPADVAMGAARCNVKLGGKEYLVGEVLFDDLVEYQNAIRQRAMDDFTKNADKFAPEAQASIVLRLSTGVQSPDDLFKQLMSPSGSQWLLGRVLERGGHDPAAIAMNLTDVLAAVIQIMTLSGLLDPKAVAAQMTKAAEKGAEAQTEA